MELKKKEFTFRGKTMEELNALDTREFAKYVEARPRRTILRQFQEIENFVNRAKEKIAKGKKIRTHKRDLVIVPRMVGMKVQIYEGHNFAPLEITGEMLGHRLGEFALTRKRVNHGEAGVGATKGSRSQSKK
jgi:small subunit ribosomal protein S19